MLERGTNPSELDIVQNPALGAYLIWQVGLGFQSESGRTCAFPLAFLVLPLIFHRPTLDVAISTKRNSGLLLFASKLAAERENLLAIHDRSLLLRRLSLQSIGFAIRTSLVSLDYKEATFRSNTVEGKKPAVPERIKILVIEAERLGYWFSKVSLDQISSSLRVDF